MVEGIDFLVRRNDLREHKFAPATLDVADGTALLRVDKFAFTANNITYAVAADLIGYWKFFPAPEGWGRVPVWGFAEVVDSKCSDLKPGDRFYGYLPMSSHLLVEPTECNDRRFIDGAKHRAGLPAVYNRYQRADDDREHEDLQALFRPLFGTAFVLDDFFADGKQFGAEAVVVTSASSKTSFSLAFLLSRRGVRVIGLTSASNVEFVRGLETYDQVVTYDDLETLDAEEKVAIADMAGNGSVVARLHRHFGDSVLHNAVVGLTHWEDREPQTGLPGAAPAFFFAPTWITKRVADWGPAAFQSRLGEAWDAFAQRAAGWLDVTLGSGQADIERVYRETLEGRARPSEGHILSF